MVKTRSMVNMEGDAGGGGEGGRPPKRAKTIQEKAESRMEIIAKLKATKELMEKESVQKLQKEKRKAAEMHIVGLLQVDGVSVDRQWLNRLDLNELTTLSEGLQEAAERNEGKEFWEKINAAEDSASAALAAAFTAQFVDPQQRLPMLLANLDERQKCASMSTTPCASVIQSSGTGKSRSLVELSSLDVYVCYCCLQSKSGFPLRTSKLADALIQEGQGEDYYRGYLKAWLEILCEHLHGNLKIASQPSTSSDPPSTSSDPPSTSSDPPSLCKQWSLDHILMKKEQVSVVIDAVNDQWVGKRTCTAGEATRALKKVCPLLPRKNEGVKILFVFDEAAQLFSNGAGNNIRRAFLSLLQSTFGVFVDTCSNVSVLAPSLDRDPSQRVRRGTLTVPPPVWEISNVNVLAEDLTGFNKLEDLTLQRLFKFGRPLWASCMSSIVDEQTAVAEAKALATRKLCGGVQENALDAIREGNERLDTSTALAILGARLVIDVNPLSRLAINLVGSHMSYVLDISDGNRCITSWEPWDPIITRAAKDIFGHKGFRKAALGHLQKCMENHWVDEGKTGELIGRYILIRAMDRARSQQFITLRDFLDVLLSRAAQNVPVGSGAQDVPVGSGAHDVRQGVVNFSGFLHAVTGYTPGLQDLMEAFMLEKAFICRTNQARFDALIPVLLPEKDGSFVLEPKNMSILGVQFKNIYGDRNMDFDASIWMNPGAAGIGGWLSEQPFATVLMQLGRPGEGSVQFVEKDKPVTRSDTQKGAAKDQPSVKHLPYIVYGLEGVYPFLEEGEWEVLQALIQCRRHRLMVQRVKEFAKTIMPLCWEQRH